MLTVLLNMLMIKLNDKQIEKLSQACSDLAAVTVGVMILPAILGKTNLFSIFTGFVSMLTFYFISVLLLKNINSC